MINLKQFIRNLIPYYQDYDVWYAKTRYDDYICIRKSLYTDTEYTDYTDFMKKYGNCPVKHVLAGKSEILQIFLKEGSADNEI